MLSRAELPQKRQVGQIVFLLWILIIAIVLAFCFFASSLCITVLLSGFLAILVDPLIEYFERLRIPRMVSAAAVIIAGTFLIGSLTYHSYRQIADVVDDLPTYARQIGDALKPLTRKIEKVQDSAGQLTTEVPTKKVPEVRIKGYPDWTTFVIRGVGPVSGAAMMVGVVPFLMFFVLVQKKRLKQKLAIVWGDKIDVSAFATSVTDMVRGFVLGNFVIGALMVS